MHTVTKSLGMFVAVFLCAQASGAAALRELESEIKALVASVAPHVVTVQATFPEQIAQFPAGGVVNIGSGLIIDSTGYILTASGVVTHFSTVAPVISVIDHQKRSHEALLFSIDPVLRIAVLYAPTLSGIPPLRMRFADWEGNVLALVVGNSFGVGPSASLMTVAGRRERDGFWQLSNPATPGYSGAPVFDSRGALGGVIVGEVASQSTDQDDRPLPAVMVTSLQVLPIINRLDSLSSRRGRPWLGISVRPQVHRDGQVMLFVSSVVSDSPAAEAGFQAGDVLLGVDTLQISYIADLADWIRRCRPGHQASIHILREGQPQTLMVTVGTR